MVFVWWLRSACDGHCRDRLGNGGDPRRRKFSAADDGDQAETAGAELVDRFAARFESLP